MRGSALNFVPRDCEAEARPADETAEAEQGQRSAFCKPAVTGAAKAGNRNHQGEGISVPRMRAEMGSPWSVSFFDTLKQGLHKGPLLFVRAFVMLGEDDGFLYGAGLTLLARPLFLPARPGDGRRSRSRRGCALPARGSGLRRPPASASFRPGWRGG